MIQKLVNDVIKPWKELGELLAQPFAFQPELSDVTRSATALAIAISHYPESHGLERSTIDRKCHACKVMTDVADMAKHGKLRNEKRHNELYVAALFECGSQNQFKFLRNAILIRHTSFGEIDFMNKSLEAIKFWMSDLQFQLNRNLAVKESSEGFCPSARLKYNERYCINMNSTRYKFVRRTANNSLVPYDPPEVRIEVY